MASSSMSMTVLAAVLVLGMGPHTAVCSGHMADGPAEGMRRFMCLNDTHYAVMEDEHEHHSSNSTNETSHMSSEHDMHMHVMENTDLMNPCDTACNATCNATACVPAYCDVATTTTTTAVDAPLSGSVRTACGSIVAFLALSFLVV
eukprot:CAMPEP_0178420688 /NCGR_PEP_ID=MMETSP0689_2-20121128/26261_1 /TAXON_ID=160604 /ORGANISM="Amphidinium massartii, Strain CS-259" /LENGTH=145 /DNA_ID=CAMNT_0020042177 /DNA_START=82 /DNA_END=519 /DNA_ORIENTATION=-